MYVTGLASASIPHLSDDRAVLCCWKERNANANQNGWRHVPLAGARRATRYTHSVGRFLFISRDWATRIADRQKLATNGFTGVVVTRRRDDWSHWDANSRLSARSPNVSKIHPLQQPKYSSQVSSH